MSKSFFQLEEIASNLQTAVRVAVARKEYWFFVNLASPKIREVLHFYFLLLFFVLNVIDLLHILTILSKYILQMQPFHTLG